MSAQLDPDGISSQLPECPGSPENTTRRFSSACSVASNSSATTNSTTASPFLSEHTCYWIASQLEYYFSRTNLQRDTYLQTLRQLNHGHVPLSIISRFAKVQWIIQQEQEAQNVSRQSKRKVIDPEWAVQHAVTNFSSQLCVVEIDTTSNQIVRSVDSGNPKAMDNAAAEDALDSFTSTSPRSSGCSGWGVRNKILGVGTITGEPLEVVTPALTSSGSLLSLNSSHHRTAEDVAQQAGGCRNSPGTVKQVSTVLASDNGDMNGLAKSASTNSLSSCCNTIILRDVPDGVTAEEILQVFLEAANGSGNAEEYPKVVHLYPDVGNCW
jgi:La domain